MTDKQKHIALGMAAAVVWGVAVIWIGTAFVEVPMMMRQLVGPFYAMAPGVVLMLMIGRIAQRRFFDAGLIDGAAPAPGSAADIDNRVLKNTVEQSVLALCLWPAISVMLFTDGPGVVLALSVGFAVARLAFWWGYHKSPPLRAFGFAATFYPTVLALLWALVLRLF